MLAGLDADLTRCSPMPGWARAWAFAIFFCITYRLHTVQLVLSLLGAVLSELVTYAAVRW